MPSFPPAPTQRSITTGTATPTGIATTVFTIAHGLGKVPTWCAVTPGNLLSSALFNVTWDGTNITVTYLAALTGITSLAWIAVG